MFDAGALIFKLQTVGAQVFKQDQAEAKQAVEKTGQASSKAATEVDKLGKSSDQTGKQSKKLSDDIKQLEKQVSEEAKASETAAQKLARLKREQEEAAAAARELSKVLLVVGAAASAMVGLAVAKNAEFDQAMSNTRAATMATAEEQKTLGAAALKAGADTAYSATEAANAEEELAKAGISVADIVGGSLNGALALAAAGQLGVARSAEIMATTLTQFGLTADKSGHVADVLAAGAGKAQGSVDDLALALTYVGPLAKSAGWSLDETGGTLAYFATQGILGEKAGTSLRGVLAALQAPSTIAAKTMDEYGLSVYDANGKMLSASGMAAQLQKAFGGLTDEERNAAMGRIFGNESLTAATLLYQGGAKAISEWTDEVNATGFAAEQAAMRQDNLAGDIEKLGGSFDTALIKTGTQANDVLRGMVQALTELVDMYGDAPEPVQALTIVVGIATGAIALFAGGAVAARAKFIELKAQLDATSVSMRRTALIGGAVGLALTGVITVVGLLMAKQAEGQAKAEAYADTLEDGTNRVTRATRDMVKENLAAKGMFNYDSAYDSAEKLGISLELVTDAAMGNADALRELNSELDLGANGSAKQKKRLEETGLALDDYYLATKNVTNAVSGESGSIEESIRVAEQKDKVTNDGIGTTEAATDAAKTATDAYLDQAKSVEKLENQLRDVIDTINKANGVNQDAISANAEYQSALAGISGEVQRQRDEYERAHKTVNGFSVSLDHNTAAGSANEDMLSKVASAAQDAAQKQYDVDVTTMSAKDAADKYYSTLQSQRDAFEKSAVAAGFNADQVKALGDRVFNLPPEKSIKILADTAAAQAAIDTYVYENSNRQIIVKIGTSRVAQGPGGAGGITQADGAVVTYHASGSVSEHHVAQIARAGDWRVWAEPETGGESYIPHAASKRARSEQIMAQTAGILGGTYIPSGVRSFADGAVVGSVPEVRVIVQPKGGIDILKYIDIRVEQGQDDMTNALRGS